MSKRFIDDKIWSDPWFQELDPLLKLFWIYLFSICDIIGIWEYNPKRAEFDLCKKLPWEEIQKKLDEKVLFTDRFWIIKTFIRQQYPKLADCPNAPLHISVMKQINKMCLNFDLNSLSIDYSNPIDRVQVIVKEKVKEKVKEEEEVIEKDKKKFIPPSFEEFRAYCVENGFGEIADRAFKGYEAGGWRDSQGKQIKSWKQKLQHVWFREENKDKKTEEFFPAWKVPMK
jgi:hypothetical protein